MKPPKPRNGPARALARPETRQRIVPSGKRKAARRSRQPDPDAIYQEIGDACAAGADPFFDGHGSPWDD